MGAHALGADPLLAWHGDDELPSDLGGVVLPGGFSYGDYLRCGAIARFSAATQAVGRFAAEGGLVRICNGFQILCEAGPPWGAAAEPLARVRLRGRGDPGRADEHITSRCVEGQRLVIPSSTVKAPGSPTTSCMQS